MQNLATLRLRCPRQVASEPLAVVKGREMSSEFRRRGLKRMRHHFAYGGPQSGAMVKIEEGRTHYRRQIRPGSMASYSYILVATPKGPSVFLPESDEDLQCAYRVALQEKNERATEVLAEEIERRGLPLRGPVDGEDPPM